MGTTRIIFDWGVIDARGAQYSLLERLHLIRCLGRWRATLYVFGQLSWEHSITPLTDPDAVEFSQVEARCRRHGVRLWAWMKPGDARYVHHRSDRVRFVDNAKRYLDMGAAGLYLLMDDLHPRLPDACIRPADAVGHAALIEDLVNAIGDGLKAICAEHYHGALVAQHEDYWRPLLEVLPPHVMVTWTGPAVWNADLTTSGIPAFGRPLLLFDNYFASDSEDVARSPICPYSGRSPELDRYFQAVLINPNNHYAWQYCALHTAMRFWADPITYDPDEAFRGAVRDLGDMYLEDLRDRGTVDD